MDPTGEARNDLELVEREGFLEVRFLGSFSIERFKGQAEAASRACRERECEKLLVDVTRLEARLTTVDRYELASHAVRVSWGLKVALYVRPDFLDPKKFGILVAQNRGLAVDAFTDRPAAVDWLLAQIPKEPEHGGDTTAP
jgi:hypothetical protein